MAKSYRVDIEITQKQIEYLQKLLNDEIFQLSGLTKVTKKKEFNDNLKAAEQLMEKLQGSSLQTA